MSQPYTGVGRDELLRLLAQQETEISALHRALLLSEKHRAMYLDNLTTTQARCTELLDMYRALKRGYPT